MHQIIFNFNTLIVVIILAAILLGINMRLSANNLSVRPQEWIAPAILILIGTFISFTPWGLGLNGEVKELFMRENFAQKRFDDYAQFLPLALVFVLNLCGVKGRHGYRDLTIISAIGILVMFCSVHAVKNLTEVLRPDGSAHNSFPSGHTSMAFVGAEILYQEYKHRAPWYGILGYLASIGVGTMRMYNNRHWMGDVVAGSGVGILSTKVAYWLLPKITAKIDKRGGKR